MLIHSKTNTSPGPSSDSASDSHQPTRTSSDEEPGEGIPSPSNDEVEDDIASPSHEEVREDVVSPSHEPNPLDLESSENSLVSRNIIQNESFIMIDDEENRQVPHNQGSSQDS